MASTSRSGRGGEEHDPFSAIEPPNKKIKSSLTAKQFDVFINHRGPDTKTILAQHLYDSLQQAGIRAYLDAPETELGDYFPSAIKNAIFSSMLHVAILSPKYAESSWCIAVLALMFRTRARIIPLFYDVQPSDFRYIKNGVSDAFSEHEKKGRYHSHDIQQWKECLQNVSGIKGYEFNSKNDDPSKLCNEIVSAVLKEKGKRKIPLQVAKYVVGLDEIVQDFDRYCQRNREMRDKIIGIFGMGGSGKTTLAKDLFNNKHSEFSGSTILFDVRETHAKGALTSLQSKLLNDLFPGNHHSFHSVEEGAAKIKHDLQGNRESRFLIVIDDADHQKQLDALLPIDALNPNSLVIVTTRDERLLIKAGVRVRYKMREMKREHSRELFCCHAFHRQSCKSGFENLVDSFVQAVAGLPLALQVMGGHVFGSGVAYWKSQLVEVQLRLDKDIKDTLKISYDALEDDQKQIFMDIACFFIGEDVSTATSIWKASGWRAEHALQTLKDKCLVEMQTQIDRNIYGDKDCHYEPKFILKMHDHLRDLGREMADKETSQPIDNQMSRPRRLWRPEDLIRMRNIKDFQDTLAVSEVKSFRCYSDIDTNLFHMKYFLGSSKTSTDLQWLQVRWADIPEWFHLQNLYSLSLVQVPPVTLWEMDDQVVLELKELSCSCISTSVDDREKMFSFGRFQNLESLRIKYFGWKFEWNWLLKSVRELANLQTFRLKNIYADGGFSLSNSGKTIDDRFRMRSLEAIVLCYVQHTMKVSISGDSCPTLKSLILCSLEDLIEVNLTGVTTLERLTLNKCRQLKHVLGNDLPILKIFHIKHCCKMCELPKFGRMICLKRVYISHCRSLQEIAAIENLKGLKKVWIAKCPKLKIIRAIEQLKGLNRIWIRSCKQLEDDVICFKELKELKRMFIGQCPSLQSMEGIEFSRCLESIIIARCPKRKNIRGIEELEGLKELIISDSPVISCVERLQRLPSELTTMVGTSVMADLELRMGCKRRSYMSYFNEDKIADTLSMVDAFREIGSVGYVDVEKVKSSIHSFQKTHHPLSAFIFCAVVSYSVRIRGEILYGSRIEHDNILRLSEVELAVGSGEEWIYTCVVTEKMFSNYDWMPSDDTLVGKAVKAAFLMGVKAGEERKTLHILQSLFAQLGIPNSEYEYILQSLFAQLGIQNSEYELKVDEVESDFVFNEHMEHYRCDYDDFADNDDEEHYRYDYDDFADYVDDDEEYNDVGDDHLNNYNVCEF